MGEERVKVTGDKSLAKFKKGKTTEEAMTEVSAQHGFVPRTAQPLMLKRRTAYVIPYGCNTRVGMIELAEHVSLKLNLYKQEAFEQGVLALIQKHGFEDLEAEFEELTKK